MLMLITTKLSSWTISVVSSSVKIFKSPDFWKNCETILRRMDLTLLNLNLKLSEILIAECYRPQRKA
jgi:hypothetical protein